MCVIAYKSKSAKLPSAETIRKMWNTNPDGAGIMWREKNGTISFKKGFMKLDDFQKFIDSYRCALEKTECAMHFRITTHGGTSKGNCHPFIIGDENCHKLDGNCSAILMHNGVLDIKPRYKDISDSGELAIRLGKLTDYIESMKALDEQFNGNRILIMNKAGTFMFGDKFKTSPENDGILYSNLNWTFPRTYGHIDSWNTGFSLITDTYKNGNPIYGYYFDEKNNCFKRGLDNQSVDFDEIDPNELSDDDYELYCNIYEVTANNEHEIYGLSREDYYLLYEEAKISGVDVDEYIDSEHCK